MSLDPAVLDALLAAGASAEMIVAAVKADAARDDARREEKKKKDAERKRVRREECPEQDWLVLRAAVFARDGYACVYCGADDKPLHCDHIIPFSRGGRSVIENLATSCGPCNSEKRDRTPQEWCGCL